MVVLNVGRGGEGIALIAALLRCSSFVRFSPALLCRSSSNAFVRPTPKRSSKPCRFFQKTGTLLLLSPQSISRISSSSLLLPSVLLLTANARRSMQQRPHLPLHPRLGQSRHLPPLPPPFLPSPTFLLPPLPHAQRPPLPALHPLPQLQERYLVRVLARPRRAGRRGVRGVCAVRVVREGGHVRVEACVRVS